VTAHELAAKEAAMTLFVLVIRLFVALIGGLVSACARMTVHSVQLVGVLARDDRQVRARRGASPPAGQMPTSHKVIAGFFIFMFLLIAYAVIRY
jgi:hypothetical protein